MVGVVVGAHHQLVGRNGALAGRTIALAAKDAQKVAPAKDLVRVGEQTGAHLAKSTITTGTL